MPSSPAPETVNAPQPLSADPAAGPSAAPQRGAEILARIRGAFARQGFEGASMTLLAREAGISAGNFYRYFPSKLAIVDALVSQDIAVIEARFQLVLQAPEPMSALRKGLADYISGIEDDDCRLMAEIAATALRQSEVAETCGRVEESVARSLLEVFTLSSGLPEAECRQRFAAHARLIVLLSRGYFQRCDLTPDPDLLDLLLQSINRLLDDIPQPSPFSASV